MCGIVGIASRRPVVDPKWVQRACASLAHRGPDGKGIWWSQDRRVGLGHRRLAVLDLSSAAAQPMIAHGQQLTIVFNGEIYNFRQLRQRLEGLGARFKSTCDTEVVLLAYAEWGDQCLEYLDGMFSLAIYDGQRNRLFLARDRVGEKPLFYWRTDASLLFASELKALMSDPHLPRRISSAGLDCYLAMGYVPGEHCILEGCNKLPPAHAMSYHLESGMMKVWRYWHPPEPSPQTMIRDKSTLREELIEHLRESVVSRLVADVPVGILLSGGLDSSIVTALAASSRPGIKTFTVRFPGHGAYDETEHARLVARHFGTSHIELEADPTTVDILPALARQFDEPVIDSSMIPTYLVCREVRRHCTVALGGDGGDELFGGYREYTRALWASERISYIPSALRKIAANFATALPLGIKGRNWLRSLKDDWASGVPFIAEYFDSEARCTLLGRRDWRPVADGIRRRRVSPQGDLLQRMTRYDFENYLAEDLLVKVDRASMMNSLEVRSPFLSRVLVEFSLSKIPSEEKATKFERKVILKEIARELLPRGFDMKRKQGFCVPLASWLKGGRFRELVEDVLYDKDCIFSQSLTRKLLKGQDSGRNNGERLFGLALFELWRREYGATL